MDKVTETLQSLRRQGNLDFSDLTNEEVPPQPVDSDGDVEMDSDEDVNPPEASNPAVGQPASMGPQAPSTPRAETTPRVLPEPEGERTPSFHSVTGVGLEGVEQEEEQQPHL
eukprot:4921710-Prorocentrum_lima.AAC.1